MHCIEGLVARGTDFDTFCIILKEYGSHDWIGDRPTRLPHNHEVISGQSYFHSTEKCCAVANGQCPSELCSQFTGRSVAKEGRGRYFFNASKLSIGSLDSCLGDRRTTKSSQMIME